jgi:hypothetical protein
VPTVNRSEPREGSSAAPAPAESPRTRVLALAAIGVTLGCGPVEYLSQVSGRATHALALAHRQGAEKLARSEYTAAAEYLREARVKAGHSSYQAAIEYGRRAEELAARAEALARERAAKATPPGQEPPGSARP